MLILVQLMLMHMYHTDEHVHVHRRQARRQATYLKGTLVYVKCWIFFSFPVTFIPVFLLMLSDLQLLTLLVPDLVLCILHTSLDMPLTTLCLFPFY